MQLRDIIKFFFIDTANIFDTYEQYILEYLLFIIGTIYKYLLATFYHTLT